jgi:3-(3-hydroxy-phenyl)propionate hydroxylase
MQERDPLKRRESLEALQRTVADPDAAREHLLRSSMITGLRLAAEIS